jgi:HPt (histidine-containing phosphotransfer) domain-containing protein
MSRANSNSARTTSDAARDEGTKEGRDEGRVGEGTVSLVRIGRLRESMPGKDALIDELIELFVSDLPARLSAIAQAVERADAPALALQAHALRGGAANFGAGRLDALCGKLEEIGARGVLAQAPSMLDEIRRESARVHDALLALKSRPRASLPDAPTPSRRSRSV